MPGKRTRRLSLAAKEELSGYLFLAPWMLGLILFFITPMVTTVRFSFSKVLFGTQGLSMPWAGLTNYRFLFYEDADFLNILIGSVRDMILSIPLIVFFSIFIAILLAPRFKGRTVARAIFFLPVIVSSGIVIQILKSDVFATAGMQGSNALFQTGYIGQLLENIGLSASITGSLLSVVSSIFDIAWKSGIQIVLFIGAIQTIPASFYEAAQVEGANAWERFWKITFPMLIPFITLNVVYSMIDNFTDYQNGVMRHVYMRIDSNDYGLAAATSLTYFLVVLLLVALTIFFISRNRKSASA